MIDDATIRDIHEAMKRQSITKGIAVTNASFSRMAQEYAQSRPIDLYGKARLQSLLQRIEM
jgi:hypothetical protein